MTRILHKRRAVVLLCLAAAAAALMIFFPRSGRREEAAKIAASRPVETQAVDLGGGLALVLVKVPAETFLMGAPAREFGSQDDERPAHQVRLSGFGIGRTEVTLAQFTRFVEESGYRPGRGRAFTIGRDGLPVEDQYPRAFSDPGFRQGPDHPVTEVSWDDAAAFCKWLSAKTGRGFHLPTEAQWECAARAGASAAWFFGDDPARGKGFMNGPDASFRNAYHLPGAVLPFDDGFVRTAPAGSFAANPYGLCDTAGNVWEWCADWYATAYYAKSPDKNPEGPDSGVFRVIRGGSFANTPESSRSASRAAFSPAARSSDIGFRVACD